MMEMNIANKLTVFRVFLIPVFLVFLYGMNVFGFIIPESRYIATAIFVVAAFTDFLDGYLARSRNLVTNFGKFMDPLADKLLTCSAMIALVGMGDLPSYVVIVIIAREFIVTGFRLIASDKNVVIAASWWGKIKTVTQMIMLVCVMMNIRTWGIAYETMSNLLVFLALIFTIVSGADYIIKNIHILDEK